MGGLNILQIPCDYSLTLLLSNSRRRDEKEAATKVTASYVSYARLMDKWGITVGSFEKLHDIRPTEERIARIGFWFFRVKRLLSDLRTQGIKVSCDHGTIDRVSKSI